MALLEEAIRRAGGARALAAWLGVQPKTINVSKKRLRDGGSMSLDKRRRLTEYVGRHLVPAPSPALPQEIYLKEIIAYLRKQAGGLELHALPDAPIVVDQLKGHIAVWAKMVRAELRRRRREA